MIKKILFSILLISIINSGRVAKANQDENYYKVLKNKAYDTISNALFDKKIHKNLKMDILEIFGTLAAGKDFKIQNINQLDQTMEDNYLNSYHRSLNIEINKDNTEQEKDLSTKILDVKFVELLTKAINNSDQEMVLYALEIISRAKIKQLLPYLEQKLLSLGDENLDVKSSMIITIGDVGTDKQINLIRGFLSHESIRIRLNALQALGDINTEKSLEVVQSYLSSDILELALLSAGILSNKNNNEAINLLMEGMKSPYISTKQKTLVAMTNITNPRILPILKKAFETDDEAVQIYAINIMSNINSDETVKILKTYLDNDTLLKSVLFALSKINTPESFKVFKECIYSKDINKKNYALYYLGNIKDKRIIPILKPILKDKDIKYNIYAAKLLDALDDESGLPILKNASNSDNESISILAASYLGYIGQDYGLDVLKDAIKHSYLPSWRKLDISIILEKLGYHPAISDLDYLLQFQRPTSLPKDLIPSKKALLTLLESNNEWTKLNAAYLMSKVSKEDCLPTLEKLSDYKDVKIRSLALELLGELGDKNALPTLKKHLDDQSARARVISSESILKILSAENNKTPDTNL